MTTNQCTNIIIALLRAVNLDETTHVQNTEDLVTEDINVDVNYNVN